MLNMCSNHEKVEKVFPNGGCERIWCWAEWENRAKKFSFHLISVRVIVGVLAT